MEGHPRDDAGDARRDMAASMLAAPREASLTGRIKGAAFREFIVWYLRECDRGELPAVVGEMASEHRRLLDPRSRSLGILPSVWYPSEVVHPLMDAACRGRDAAAVTALAREGAENIMRMHLRGVYKMVFGLAISPPRLLSLIGRLWSLHYDDGTLEVEAVDAHTHYGIVRDWSGHHRLICELNRQANIPLYEAMGCRSVRIEGLTCVSFGDEACSARTSWG